MGRVNLYGVGVLLFGGSLAIAQQSPEPGEPTGTQREVRELRQEVQSLREELRERDPRADEQLDDEERDAGLGFRYDPRPGWEKPELWMWPAFRAEETKRLRIGSTHNIDLYIGLKTTGRFQYLTQDDVFIAAVEQGDLEPAFQTAWGDLSFMADVEDGKMLIFADLYLSSRPHPSTTYGNEGYILIRELPDAEYTQWLNNSLFKAVNVKVGHFEIDYGDHHYRRSDNAWVQRNLLIGNYLVDPDVEEIGMEVFSKPGPVNWLVGVTSGTTTENLNEGRGIASIHGKLWVEPERDFRASVSGYYVDHAENPPTGPGATSGRLFSGRRSGGPYGGVWGGGNSPGDLTIGGDELVTAFQGDLTYSPGPWEFYGHVGWVQDEDPNGSLPGEPTARWIYGAVEGAYHFTPRLYAAARYGLAQADEINGADANGRIHRIQVGAGYWLTQNLLGKAEYVYQWANGFDPADGLVGGVDIANEPMFNGIMLEVSFAF